MTTLNLDHLATFLAIVRAGNFHVAARTLGMTQGAVSQHLRKLETALDVRLLTRHPRGCTPTREGDELTSYAESLLQLNARAVAALREGRIAVGASSNIGIYLLQPYVKSYLTHTQGRYPVDVRIHQNPTIAEKLEVGEINVATMEWWDNRPGYVARRWRREPLVAIVPPDHEWAELPFVPRELLKRASLLGGEPGTGTGRVLAHYFGDDAGELQMGMQLGSTEAVKQWVKAGLGVSLVLAGTVEKERRDGTLAAIPLEGEPPCKDLYVIWRDSLGVESPPRLFAEWLAAQTPTQSVPLDGNELTAVDSARR